MRKYKTIVNTLESFVDKLVQEKGLDNLDDEVLGQIKSDLISRLDDRINAAILAALPSDKLEDFEKIFSELDQIEKEAGDEMDKLILQHAEELAKE